MARAARITIFAFLCAAVVALQYAYDASRTAYVFPDQPASSTLIRAFDLGLDAAAASFLWLSVRVELPFLPYGLPHFLSNLEAVNRLDPRFSEPYAFTVLVLPSIKDAHAEYIDAALAVGERGIKDADPNWQIPFYMGTTYQLNLNDRQNAARYFDVAATTPGVPDIIRRFAVNYGIEPNLLGVTKDGWAAIYQTSADPAVRDRAAAHIAHLEIIQYLDDAAQAFYRQTGAYPATVDQLIERHIIPSVPADPLGFHFKMYDQGVAGIAPQ